MVIAPALIIALCGLCVSACRLIALNVSPLGSTPTYRETVSWPNLSRASPNINGFEIDWIVKGWAVSPTSKRRPEAVANAIANSSGFACPSSGMYVATWPVVSA